MPTFVFKIISDVSLTFRNFSVFNQLNSVTLIKGGRI